MKIKDLKENPKNPRTSSKEKLDMLEKAMEEFGDLGCIVFNRRSGHLVGGHQRVRKIPKSTEIVVDQKYPEPTLVGTVLEGHFRYKNEVFKYREVDWDEAKEKAATIAANKGFADWNLTLLTEHLLELDSLNIDMDITGFSSKEIENLMAPEKDSKEKKACPKCGFKKE